VAVIKKTILAFLLFGALIPSTYAAAHIGTVNAIHVNPNKKVIVFELDLSVSHRDKADCSKEGWFLLNTEAVSGDVAYDLVKTSYINHREITVFASGSSCDLSATLSGAKKADRIMVGLPKAELKKRVEMMKDKIKK